MDRTLRYSLETCINRVAVNIVWAYRDQFDVVVLRQCWMNTLMSFVGCVGTLLAESRLQEIMKSTLGGVSKILNSKRVSQNIGAFFV